MKFFRLSCLAISAFVAHASVSSEAAEMAAPRERILFNQGWHFQKGEPKEVSDALSYSNLKPWLLPTAAGFVTDAAAKRPAGDPPGAKLDLVHAAYDDSKWRLLDLPHDWGVESDFDQNLPGETGKLPWFGTAWYRKTFDLSAADLGRRVSLEIDGAMSYSAVWCNGTLVGGWPHGYASYSVDLSPFLKEGANTLAIRLDNLRDSSRWYPGGGIYRNVWLVKTSPVHVVPTSAFVTTPAVSPISATVDFSARVRNGSATPSTIRAAVQVFRLSAAGVAEGAALATAPVVTGSAAAGDEFSVKTQVQLAKPALWTPEDPSRYVAVLLVQHEGKAVDRLEVPFGIRTAEFTANDGFHLNGQRVPIQGVCMHHDLGSLGAAFNIRAAERQLEMLKEMGCNAIRTAHNPPAPELLDLCDRMGFLVMVEFTDTWTQKKKPNGYAKLFTDWSEPDVRSMVRRGRNHPSVIVWSIGNEIGEQGMPKLHPIAEKLRSIAREEDPTRPVTAGCDRPQAGSNGFQKTVDVFGYNYKPHLYGKFHTENPAIPLYGSETSSAVSSRGEYAFPVSENKADGKIGFQMSSYDLYAPAWATTPDTEFKAQEENPFVAGEFVWTGFDYLGEPTPFNDDATILTNFHSPEEKAKAEEEIKLLGKLRMPSRSSYFGIIDLAGFKKDRFYLYQSQWRPELPVAHILPHWNWPERVGEVTPVHVYTSGDEAELFLNGKSLGRKKKANLEYRIRWDDVKYEPGELKVATWKDGKKWADASVKTTGEPAKLILTPDRAKIVADGVDLAFVTLTIADLEGVMVPKTHPLVKFEITGPGEIVSTDNGDATDHTSFKSHERPAFNGLALAIVRAKPGSTEPFTIRATSDGLIPAETTINPVSR